MVTQLDTRFKEIKSLKWLPFVGDQYLGLDISKKILIVGESHYGKTDTAVAAHESDNMTRDRLWESGINKWYYGTKIYSNLHRAIFGNDNFDGAKFWNLVSFYNFVQRPMSIISKNERPNGDDYYNGWQTFFETVTVLKPKICLFIGLEGSNFLSTNISEQHGFTLKSMERDSKIGAVYPRKAILIDAEGNEIKLVFIHHTGSYFSWQKWHNYLKSIIGDQIAWLEGKVSVGV